MNPQKINQQPETHGKTIKSMDIQQESKEKITKSNDWCSVRAELPAHAVE
jgi:hypothetical protein